MVVVSVPDAELADRVRRAVGEVARVLVWDTSAPVRGLDEVTVFVPPYTPTPVSSATLDLLPKLEVIQLLTAGYDGWAGVRPPTAVVCNAVGVHGVSTAELAVALLLATARDLPKYGADQRAQVTHKRVRVGLTERPVMVLGAGDIGARVAASLRPLGASVTLVGRTPRDGVRSIEDLPELLSEHRALVIAIPLTERTRGLIGRQQLAALPDGAIVVNVARGPIIDTDALVAEVNTGRLTAALDVTDPEPLPPGHPLWSAPGVLLTPHVGGGTRDWPARAAQLIADQLALLARGRAPEHIVLSPVRS
jgi:phosphoglycerate dehydrogenase-like enzyme